jgi:hypothetical protein
VVLGRHEVREAYTARLPLRRACVLASPVDAGGARFEGEDNRFDEDAKGLTNVGETGDPAMAPAPR